VSRDEAFKLSQDATNELWSVVLRREYPNPGARKRAIEHCIRAAVETAANLPSTVDGYEDGCNPLFHEPSPKIVPNPYAGSNSPTKDRPNGE
jgi:hypothetical protein